MVNNASMEETYKAEAECLRNLVRQCGELLFKYGHTFDKSDREKTIELLAIIKNRQNLNSVDDWFMPKVTVVKYGEQEIKTDDKVVWTNFKEQDNDL